VAYEELRHEAELFKAALLAWVVIGPATASANCA
jgi:hypothetical protein